VAGYFVQNITQLPFHIHMECSDSRVHQKCTSRVNIKHLVSIPLQNNGAEVWSPINVHYTDHLLQSQNTQLIKVKFPDNLGFTYCSWQVFT
jgi:hypothetical protein